MARITTAHIVAWWLRENGRGILLVLAVFVALSAPFAIIPGWLASPVLERTETTGIVLTVRTWPINPKVAIGRGFSYEYLLRLPDGSQALVSGPILQPHAIGEAVELTRAVRQNGRISYAFRSRNAPRGSIAATAGPIAPAAA